jgi:serine/threonine protein phosphatase 1
MSEKISKRFVVGDLHGNYKGFIQALTRADFDYDNDLLISLGDIADGYSQVPEIIEEFKLIKNLIWILGNHDEWVQNWMSGKTNMQGVGLDGHPTQMAWGESMLSPDAHMWLSQGGRATFIAYMRQPHLITEHRDFWLKKPVLYYVLDQNSTGDDEDNIPQGGKCFVHGGFNRDHSIYYQSKKTPHVLYWDRSLWSKALSAGKDVQLITDDKFDEIFIGHTSTQFWGTTHPMNAGGIWNIDTGAGWGGCVTIMNIDTKEYYQSDLAETLYPGEKPRK